MPENCVIHSFRHSLRDRLRAVECPSDIVDAIGGWKTPGVGHGYGNGYSLEVLEKWMNKIECQSQSGTPSIIMKSVSEHSSLTAFAAWYSSLW